MSSHHSTNNTQVISNAENMSNGGGNEELLRVVHPARFLRALPFEHKVPWDVLQALEVMYRVLLPIHEGERWLRDASPAEKRELIDKLAIVDDVFNGKDVLMDWSTGKQSPPVLTAGQVAARKTWLHKRRTEGEQATIDGLLEFKDEFIAFTRGHEDVFRAAWTETGRGDWTEWARNDEGFPVCYWSVQSTTRGMLILAHRRWVRFDTSRSSGNTDREGDNPASAYWVIASWLESIGQYGRRPHPGFQFHCTGRDVPLVAHKWHLLIWGFLNIRPELRSVNFAIHSDPYATLLHTLSSSRATVQRVVDAAVQQGLCRPYLVPALGTPNPVFRVLLFHNGVPKYGADAGYTPVKGPPGDVYSPLLRRALKLVAAQLPNPTGAPSPPPTSWPSIADFSITGLRPQTRHNVLPPSRFGFKVRRNQGWADEPLLRSIATAVEESGTIDLPLRVWDEISETLREEGVMDRSPAALMDRWSRLHRPVADALFGIDLGCFHWDDLAEKPLASSPTAWSCLADHELVHPFLIRVISKRISYMRSVCAILGRSWPPVASAPPPPPPSTPPCSAAREEEPPAQPLSVGLLRLDLVVTSARLAAMETARHRYGKPDNSHTEHRWPHEENSRLVEAVAEIVRAGAHLDQLTETNWAGVSVELAETSGAQPAKSPQSCRKAWKALVKQFNLVNALYKVRGFAWDDKAHRLIAADETWEACSAASASRMFAREIVLPQFRALHALLWPCAPAVPAGLLSASSHVQVAPTDLLNMVTGKCSASCDMLLLSLLGDRYGNKVPEHVHRTSRSSITDAMGVRVEACHERPGYLRRCRGETAALLSEPRVS